MTGSNIDVKIVIIMVTFVAMYGIFTFLFSNEQYNTYNINYSSNQNYSQLTQTNFFDTLSNMYHLSFNDDLWFLNVTLGSLFMFLGVFIVLRYIW